MHSILTILALFACHDIAHSVTLAPDSFKIQSYFDTKNTQEIYQRANIRTNGKEHNYKFVNQSFGVLTSPGYPVPFPGNTTTKWRIEMQDGSRIVLMIRQFFLGPGDELEIYNYNNEETQLYTSQKPPNDLIFLTSDALDITLRTSSSDISDLINMTGRHGSKQRLFYAMFEREGCGGVLTRSHGYINIPFYIHETKRPHECLWTIEADDDHVITLEFLDFDLAPGSCIYNNIYVRDGDFDGGYSLGDFCEENPPFSKLRSVRNTMSIVYRVRPNLYEGEHNQLPNIKMFYRMVDSCGGDLEGYSGNFETPTYWHNEKYSCQWRINVPESKIILLHIKDWNQRHHTAGLLEEHVQVTSQKENSIIWDSYGEDSVPPEALLIPSNQGVINWIAGSNDSVRPYLHFRAFYEAVLPTTNGECFSIADKEFFMCYDETYIDCTKRCNGVADCEAGNDEKDCPTSGVRRSFGPTPRQEQFEAESPQQLDKRNGIKSYVVLWLSAIGLSILVIISIIAIDHVLKKSQARPVKNIEPPPPPYQEFTEQEHSGYSFNSTNIQSPPHPPPYESTLSYGGDDTTLPGTERNDELMSRAYSVPFNLQNSQNSTDVGSSESLYRPRHHSTPFGAYYSSTSTLGSSESLPRGRFNYLSSSDGSSESLSRVLNNRTNTPIAALFHDTDVIESTTTCTTITPVQFFRYSDSQENHEEFLQQIGIFKEPEA